MGRPAVPPDARLRSLVAILADVSADIAAVADEYGELQTENRHLSVKCQVLRGTVEEPLGEAAGSAAAAPARGPAGSTAPRRAKAESGKTSPAITASASKEVDVVAMDLWCTPESSHQTPSLARQPRSRASEAGGEARTPRSPHFELDLELDPEKGGGAETTDTRPPTERMQRRQVPDRLDDSSEDSVDPDACVDPESFRNRPKTSSAEALGSDDPFETVQEQLQLWPVWDEGAKNGIVGGISSKSTKSMRMSTTVNILNSSTRRQGDSLSGTSFLQRFIARPSSPRRIVWDFLSVVVMLYDVIHIPLQVFEFDETMGERVANLTVTCFWTADIVASFCLGYHHGGLIEMRPAKVARHYIQTWFPIDFTVVTIDWVVLLVQDDRDKGIGLMRLNKTLRFIRVLRVLRLLRLLRILKVWSVMSELNEMIQSEVLLTTLSVLQFILFVLLLNHYIACIWYGLGSGKLSWEEPSCTWVLRLQEARYEGEISFGYAYSTSLHWSLTQFTPASMEVVPCNTTERLFTICVLLFAVVLFSSLMSSITSSMINLRKMTAERRKQQSHVRKYITDKHVTLETGNRISGFLRQHNYNVTHKQNLHEDEIYAFKILPESLRAQMRCEVYLPLLEPHPMFGQIHAADESAMVDICQSCATELDLYLGQEAFSFGKLSKDMYVSVRGALEYYSQSESKHPFDVKVGSIISEAAMWVVWEHKGRLVAAEACEVVVLSGPAFRQAVGRNLCLNFCQIYARTFQEKLLKIHQEQDRDFWALQLSDLSWDNDVLLEMTRTSFNTWSASSDLEIQTSVVQEKSFVSTFSMERFVPRNSTGGSPGQVLMSPLASLRSVLGLKSGKSPQAEEPSQT